MSTVNMNLGNDIDAWKGVCLQNLKAVFHLIFLQKKYYQLVTRRGWEKIGKC
jgi:hypothetical protein